jgi:hypothetical protein
MGKRRNAYNVLVGIPEGMKPLNRSMRRWKFNIKIILSKWYGTVWIVFAWFRKICSVGML